MSCRKVVCQECATLFDGQNTCRPCLQLREAGAKARSSILAPLLSLVAGLVLLAAAAYAMAWAGALTARSW